MINKKLERDRCDWLRKNRGALKAISEEMGFSRTFVGEVFWGKKPSADSKVEKRLAMAGVPGFAL